ncbi:hypothetical protein ACFQ21_27000 [Ohtaekwangia kribbensis]|uniref:Capsule polysaccharide biosynthesis protein n=1 Tax=Ohtaekwangia kribbensis TaxID=688913 RepID=A0ABW3KCC6_9BACT
MNTLIVSAYNVKTYSRSIMLDQLAQYVESKSPSDKIYYLNCSNSFDTCYFNFDGKPDVCFSCRINANRSLDLVEGDFVPLKFEDILIEEDWKQAIAFFKDNAAIDFDTKYDNFEIGESLLSVYISNTRNRDVALANKSNYILKAKINSLALYFAIKRFLKQNNIDKVVSFNGRQDYKRAILRASETLGIDCYNYERTRPGGYLEIFKNALPHNIVAKTEWIEKAWSDPDYSLEEKMKIGAQFYEGKKAGKAIVDKSYVSSQQKGLLPEGVKDSKKNIVLFTSSDDEFAAVGKEYQNPFFFDQLDGIRYIVDLVGKQLPEVNLIIRMHPNLKGVKEVQATGIAALNKVYPNIHVILPESTVDSYALLDIAEKVIVFGSSIGIESSFWRKPVILLGKSFYWYLDVAYTPKDKQEILSLLQSDLLSKDITGCIKYGFYALKGGVKAKYYDQKGPTSTPLFKGIKMNDYDFGTKILAKIISVVHRVFNIKMKLKWIQ